MFSLSNILGICGFIISIINLVYFFIIRRKKLKISILYFGKIEKFNKSNFYQVKFVIENQSQLPVTISRVRVKNNNEWVDSYPIPRLVAWYSEKENDKIIEYQEVNSTIMPIHLVSLGAFVGYVCFLFPQDSLPDNKKCLTFEIYTNRGNPVQKTFSLCDNDP